MKQIIECPNCNRDAEAILKSNRWVKWIDVVCNSCDYESKLINLDFIQPNSPFYKEIYGNNPIEEEERERKNNKWEKENLKDRREIELRLRVKRGELKPWEMEDIKHITKERNLE